MFAQGQRINNDLVSAPTYQNTTLNAALAGSTAVTCMRFAAAGTISNALFFAETGTLAVDGTVVVVTQPGLFVVELDGSQPASQDNTYGISLGATAAVTGLPTFGTNGCLRVSSLTTPAATVMSLSLSAIVSVSLATAKTTTALQGANNIRGLIADTSGGGVPGAASVTAASVTMRIMKIQDVSF